MTIPGAGSWLSIWTSGQHEDVESASALSVFTGGQWRPGGTNKVIVNPTDKPHEIRQALQSLSQLAGNTDPATAGLVSDAGSSTHYAGELHGHKISKSALNQLLYSRVTPTAVAATAVVGTSTEPSHDDHVHSWSVSLLHDLDVDLGTGDLIATDLTATNNLYADHILEYTSAHGVVIDTLTTIKDGDVSADSFSISTSKLGSSEFGYLDGIDQFVGTTGTPTFAYLSLYNVTGNWLRVGADADNTCIVLYEGNPASVNPRWYIRNTGEMNWGPSAGSFDVTLSRTDTNTMTLTGDLIVENFDATSLSAGTGAVGTPSIAFTTDADNGLYLIGANDVGFAIAGALTIELKAAEVDILRFTQISNALGDCLRLTYIAPG